MEYNFEFSNIAKLKNILAIILVIIFFTLSFIYSKERTIFLFFAIISFLKYISFDFLKKITIDLNNKIITVNSKKLKISEIKEIKTGKKFLKITLKKTAGLKSIYFNLLFIGFFLKNSKNNETKLNLFLNTIMETTDIAINKKGAIL